MARGASSNVILHLVWGRHGTSKKSRFSEQLHLTYNFEKDVYRFLSWFRTIIINAPFAIHHRT